MIDRQVADPVEREDVRWAATRKGANGHAVFGPYEQLEAGRYGVEFMIAAAPGQALDADRVVAVVDVSSDDGQSEIAMAFVLLSQLGNEPARIRLDFTIDRPRTLEYRVRVNGSAGLLIAEDRTVTRSPEDRGEPIGGRPALLASQPGLLRHIFEKGGTLAIEGQGLIVTLEGISFHARVYDDINFVDELFFKSAYNVKIGREACVIDVGLNVALASLLFARIDRVREVHAFEPFAATHSRALANLALNPSLAAKVRTYNFGLGERDEDATLLIDDNGGDSGGMATRSVEGGTPMQITIRDAASTLGPIITSARERGLQVIAKIDCEGAEFAIFTSLAEAGLFAQIDALMVEWHRVFEGRTQEELIRPLTDAGFMVFDLTPESGNGFFYAARPG